MQIVKSFSKCGHTLIVTMPDDLAKLQGLKPNDIIQRPLLCPDCFKATQADNAVEIEKLYKLPALMGQTESAINFGRSSRAQIVKALVNAKANKKVIEHLSEVLDAQDWIDMLPRKAAILANATSK